ncbi:phosphoglycerate kinase, cytosolic-like [Lycium ferocissimum]|uniref:phosphoglycerate kinase, cytosolic-like n=1 Tax=Lycium ferocissimum TaxID=112874 RepID=UPI002815389C|nr:phosphoglycerate kinase, cytosolic-like [Lycium ferocissimum]XP_059305870.1 phosphoglycerate kinase, cytosolic-like [Lycium ferocissimum]XP_059305871.1 phosphoglycerate kinase, cytosolic-like [Lycium ferocissimum]XP_059305872.1 phosphoglycerate kinase, cytosolic-like [Lycium ferocissimum]
MSQVLNFFLGYSLPRKSDCHIGFSKFQDLPQIRPVLSYGKSSAVQKCKKIQFLLKALNLEVDDHADLSSFQDEAEAGDGRDPVILPHVRTLRNFPLEELIGKVVLVRLDLTILLREKKKQQSPAARVISTIKYLHKAGAKLILTSSWSRRADSQLLKLERVAEFLSSELELKVIPVELGSGFEQSQMEDRHKLDILLLENLSRFKQEQANCSEFARRLSSGVDIFVNDAFFQSHKILASNVGITSFCYASIAGFHFDDGMSQLKKIIEMNKRPYYAIIGGANLAGKASALQFLASKCDGLVFVGDAAFQIMHAFGLPVPMKLVEQESLEAANMLVEAAKVRGVQIILPKDFWCLHDHYPLEMKIFPANHIMDGWKPVDVGPTTLEEMLPMLSRCKKILWIGAVKFSSSNQESAGASKLAAMLHNLSQKNCDLIVVGKQACETFVGKSSYVTADTIENASIVWEFLKGRKLHGLLALDRAYPFELNWNAIYANTTQPLVVDVGSGNGLFLFRMAKMRRDWNLLGMELNEKLVSRCLDHVSQSGMSNRYFIATNATSTFRSIVSSYPGDLVLVSIQCPNPDFNRTEHRWRMVQRSLVEAIADLLASDGKVFLQSDVKQVAVRMKEEFMKYGKGKLTVVHDLEDNTRTQDGWLKENPFGIRSDWEQHVIDRGAPMYRLLLLKSSPSG